MYDRERYNVPQNFENLFKVLSSQRFLNKEGLGGELPFFIHSYPTSQQIEVELNIQSLKKRLDNDAIEVIEVNLYNLIIDILIQKNALKQVFEQESKMSKQRLAKVLAGPLNIEKVILPAIHSRIEKSTSKIIFITGVAAVFPIIRSHTILNNLQTLVDEIPVVMFFPGTYNKKTLKLFDRLKDENYYQAHNLNDYNI